MTASTQTHRKAQRRTLSRLAHEAGPALRLAIAAPLVGGVLLVAQAFVLAQVLGRTLVESEPLAGLWPLAGLALALMLARAGITALGERWGIAAAEAIKQMLRLSLFDALMAKPIDFTTNRSSGALAATALEQVEALEGYFARYLPAMVSASVLPLAFAVVAMQVDWVAGLLFLLTAPLIPVFMALAGWGAEAATKAQAGALTRLSGRFADRLRGILTLKLMGRAEAETRAIVEASKELRRRTMAVLRIAFLSSAVLEFFAALGVAGIALYVGLTFIGYLTVNPELSLAGGLFLLLMAPEVYQPLRILAAHYHDRAAALAALDEIERHFEVVPEIETAPQRALPLPGPVPAKAVGLAVAGLKLTTPDGRTTLLEDTRFDIAPGEHVALLGPSGSGKSTLIETLARMRPASGTILLGDRLLASLPEAQLRTELALLGQRPRLFAGTIAQNIRLGRPDASERAVEAAALRACVTDFAGLLPNWLDARIGEGGLGLSAGEASRVALARLYLLDPSIVLLDEPTAHLDGVTESRVIEGLVGFCAGRTLLVATHSPALGAAMQRSLRLAGQRLLPSISPPLNRFEPQRESA
ncbi:MAG: thiol reductant ABC exporter subunit CydD [Devosia sp.]